MGFGAGSALEMVDDSQMVYSLLCPRCTSVVKEKINICRVSLLKVFQPRYDMRLMWLWIGSILPFVVIADKLCLPEGIAEDTRVYVNHFSESAGTPIRFLVYDWPSAKAATSIANILIRETLGIHSVMNETIDTVLEATLKLSGCEDVDCQTEDTRLVRHAALETWSSAANELLSFQAAHPEKAPVDLGSIGYQSEEHLFVSAATVSKAYEETGNSLANYRGYNRSHHSKAHQYFAQLVDLPEDEFVPCNESKWVNPAFLNPYVKYTGDLDGVIEVTDGNFHARCHKSFWIAPSCRHNVSECIPIVTSGYGWLLDTIMLWHRGSRIRKSLQFV